MIKNYSKHVNFASFGLNVSILSSLGRVHEEFEQFDEGDNQVRAWRGSRTQSELGRVLLVELGFKHHWH